MPTPDIQQNPAGYRHSVDPLLLCAFAAIAPNDRVADLGTGCGVIPLLLAGRGKGREFVGVEVQEGLAAQAAANVSGNGLAGRITIVPADLRELPAEIAPASFDVVLANPPYRTPGRGRLAPGEERAAARHELAGGLDDFLAAAARLLAHGGRCAVILLPDRLVELLAAMRARRLEPKRLRLVHSRPGRPACLVLVEGRKGGRPGLAVEAPLLVYGEGEGRDYSEEMLGIFAEFR